MRVGRYPGSCNPSATASAYQSASTAAKGSEQSAGWWSAVKRKPAEFFARDPNISNLPRAATATRTQLNWCFASLVAGAVGCLVGAAIASVGAPVTAPVVIGLLVGASVLTVLAIILAVQVMRHAALRDVLWSPSGFDAALAGVLSAQGGADRQDTVAFVREHGAGMTSSQQVALAQIPAHSREVFNDLRQWAQLAEGLTGDLVNLHPGMWETIQQLPVSSPAAKHHLLTILQQASPAELYGVLDYLRGHAGDERERAAQELPCEPADFIYKSMRLWPDGTNAEQRRRLREALDTAAGWPRLEAAVNNLRAARPDWSADPEMIDVALEHHGLPVAIVREVLADEATAKDNAGASLRHQAALMQPNQLPDSEYLFACLNDPTAAGSAPFVQCSQIFAESPLPSYLAVREVFAQFARSDGKRIFQEAQQAQTISRAGGVMLRPVDVVRACSLENARRSYVLKSLPSLLPLAKWCSDDVCRLLAMPAEVLAHGLHRMTSLLTRTEGAGTQVLRNAGFTLDAVLALHPALENLPHKTFEELRIVWAALGGADLLGALCSKTSVVAEKEAVVRLAIVVGQALGRDGTAAAERLLSCVEPQGAEELMRSCQSLDAKGLATLNHVKGVGAGQLAVSYRYLGANGPESLVRASRSSPEELMWAVNTAAVLAEKPAVRTAFAQEILQTRRDFSALSTEDFNALFQHAYGMCKEKPQWLSESMHALSGLAEARRGDAVEHAVAIAPWQWWGSQLTPSDVVQAMAIAPGTPQEFRDNFFRNHTSLARWSVKTLAAAAYESPDGEAVAPEIAELFQLGKALQQHRYKQLPKQRFMSQYDVRRLAAWIAKQGATSFAAHCLFGTVLEEVRDDRLRRLSNACEPSFLYFADKNDDAVQQVVAYRDLLRGAQRLINRQEGAPPPKFTL